MVELHLQCFTPAEHLLVLCGAPALGAIYRWFATSPETFAILAMAGNRIVGLCTACQRPYHGPMIRNNAAALVLGALRRPWIFFHPAFKAWLKAALTGGKKHGAVQESPEQKGPAQLGFLAVHESFLGARLGEAMLKRAAAECQSRGWSWIRAGIYQTNLPARFMYTKLGWKENKQLRAGPLIFMEIKLPPA
jgi:GNAT superfamily N-acetyltransferase